MGRRLLRVFAAILAALLLLAAASLPAIADEGTATFAVDASAFGFDNPDGPLGPEDGSVLTFEDAASLDDGTSADVELRFPNVVFDDGGAFVSADVVLVVVDAPEGALVALLVERADGEADEADVLVGPAAGLALRLEPSEDGLAWSLAEDGLHRGFEMSLPFSRDEVPALVPYVLGVLSRAFDGLKQDLPDFSLEEFRLNLQDLNFDRLLSAIPSFAPDEFGLDFNDYEFDELDYSDEDFYVDEWDDEPEVEYYTVTFKDPDGRILDEQEVEYGGAAKAPKIPRRVDETFLYWDRDFSYVTGDLVVRAVYSGTVPSTGDATASASALAALAALGLAILCCSVRLGAKSFVAQSAR